MLAKCLFDKKEKKLDYYRGKDCIEKLHKKLKECATNVINHKEKEMAPVPAEENQSYEEQEACHICEGKFCTDENDEHYKNIKNIRDHCHYTGKFKGAAYSNCNLNYKAPRDIPIIIHNASYETQFIINKLAEEFKGDLDFIG